VIYKEKSLALAKLVPEFDGPIYKRIFPDISSLFPGPNFPIMIIAAQVAWSS
jgi:hypothetical protein